MLNKWLNRTRLRDYPRLILVSSWTIVILNIALHQGWVGGLNNTLIGGDFIANYTGGLLYRTDIQHLYDHSIQENVQLALVSPTIPPGFAPFISPPYVAMAYSGLTYIPLSEALLIWVALIFLFSFSGIYLTHKFLVPTWLVQTGLTRIQLGVIIFSSFVFIVGTLAAQNHAITFLLVTGVLLATRYEKWTLAGILAGLLIYKPQFALGFLIIWLVWRRIRALASFSLVAVVWIGTAILNKGIEPYLDYLKFSEMLLLLPYAKDSFPISIMATPYALLTTLIPVEAIEITQAVHLTLIVALTLWVGFCAYQMRDIPYAARGGALTLAILYPLLVAPHTLIYDLIILVPAFLLLAYDRDRANKLKYPVIGTYLGALILPLIGYVAKVALAALIPLLIFITQVRTLWDE